MTPYPPTHGEPDDYSRSRAYFEQIIIRLGDTEIMGYAQAEDTPFSVTPFHKVIHRFQALL